MAKILQFRRGTGETLNGITGAEGEIFVDLDANTIRVHDGILQGGVKLATEDYVDGAVFDGDYNSLTNKPDLTVFDNVDSFANLAAFPASGETYKVYIAEDTGYIYRWSGSAYVQLTDQTAIWGQISGTLSGQTDLQNALNAKQATLVSGTNIKTINGSSVLGSGDIDLSTNLTLAGNELRYTNIDGTLQTVDLSAYLDDTTNTVVSGTLSGNSITFTREDSTTFTVDVTALYDDTNLVTSVNGNAGAITVQETLVSGTNIKTINGDSVLGSGNIVVSASASFGSISEDVLPSVTGVYDLGSTTKNWYDLFVSNGINFGSSVTLSLTGGYLNLNADLVTQDLTSTSALVGDVLISTNIITPDNGGYAEGELVIDGNLDVQGDYLNLPIPINSFIGSIWSSGGSLSTGRRQNASAGTMTAGLTFGGRISAFVLTNTTEEYNGTSWSSGGTLPQTRENHGGNGTQTAALSVGGPTTNVYEYDGTSWSSGATYPNDKTDGIRSAGSQTAAVAFGGSSTYSNLTYEYDGTSWYAGGNLITSRAFHGGGGTQTAALAFGGLAVGDRLSSTEEYNGTTWSSSGSLSQPISDNGGASNNSSAEPSAISAGGITDSGDRIATTEEYDGSLWTVASNLPFTTSHNSCTGNSSDGFLSIGGDKLSGGFSLSDTYELTPSVEVSADGEKGQIRFNYYTSKFEGYDGTSWVVFNP